MLLFVCYTVVHLCCRWQGLYCIRCHHKPDFLWDYQQSWASDGFFPDGCSRRTRSQV